MKNVLLCSLLVTSFCSVSFADTSHFGFGEGSIVQDGPCLTEEQRHRIQAEIDGNIARLEAEGKIHLRPSAVVLFSWPLRSAGDAASDPGYHGVSGFVDHNPSYPNLLLDYYCGSRTYDLPSGYNHKGTDYFNWPFLWNKMDSSEVEIVAAAAGTIVYKQDGNYDRNCGFGSGNWNAVYVQHADGSVAWYGHMKNGSTTAKNVGETVSQGEYLGVVGSSGNSTGPHLHLEIYDSGNNLIDPYTGACNGLNPSTWWASQRPYYDKTLNKISTHSATVSWGSCPNQDVTNIADAFEPGSTIYFYTFGRDGQFGDLFQYRIYRPDSSTYTSWSYNIDVGAFYAAYWLYWFYTIPAGEPQGVWRYEVIHNGVTYQHSFTIGTVSPVAFTGIDARAMTGAVEITWGLYADEAFDGFRVYRKTQGVTTSIEIQGDALLDPSSRRFVDHEVRSGLTYEYEVATQKPDGSVIRSRTVTVSVKSASLFLAQNVPNPFNPRTTIRYSQPVTAHVVIRILDVHGRRVVTLVDGVHSEGTHEVIWNGRDANGNAVGTGVYFYELVSGKTALTKKMVLIK